MRWQLRLTGRWAVLSEVQVSVSGQFSIWLSSLNYKTIFKKITLRCKPLPGWGAHAFCSVVGFCVLFTMVVARVSLMWSLISCSLNLRNLISQIPTVKMEKVQKVFLCSPIYQTGFRSYLSHDFYDLKYLENVTFHRDICRLPALQSTS